MLQRISGINNSLNGSYLRYKIEGMWIQPCVCMHVQYKTESQGTWIRPTVPDTLIIENEKKTYLTTDAVQTD